MANYLFDTLFNGQAADSTFAQMLDGSSISYGELMAETGRVANALTQLGLKDGDRVAAQVDKSLAAIALYLGTVRAGGVFLPLNTAYTGSEISYFLGDAEPRVFVCRETSESELRPIAKASGSNLQTLSADGNSGSWAKLSRGANAEFLTVDRKTDDLAAILYTSGTTGRAKGAMISHQNLASNAETLVDYWHISANDVLLHALPIFHTHGLFVAINSIMVAGASMLFMPRFDAEQALAQLTKCNLLMGVPTFYTRLLALEGFNQQSTAHMRLFISGSAPMTMETHKAFQERTGQVILERYGMTETNMITSNPYDAERIAGSVGFPLPGVEVRITEADSKEVVELTSEQVGMIEVRGANVFQGYWKQPEKTAAELRSDGFFITGDIGQFDSSGYLHIVGRNKDLIISGGYNVYPKEIEILIDRLDGVFESAIIGLPHKDLGEGVTAIIVRSENATIDEAAIKSSLADELAKYKQPKKYIFVDALPRNAMGKVQKNELRRSYEGLFD